VNWYIQRNTNEKYDNFSITAVPKPTQSCAVTLKLETEMDERTRENGAKVARIVYSSRPEKKYQ
jgi:hypothetical protein